METEESEDSAPEAEEPKAEADSPPPQIPTKRKTMRGIQVMPSPSGGVAPPTGESNETPNWLQQLRSRNSTKRESAPLSVAPKPEEVQTETPGWLANLRKNPKPSEGSPSRPPQPVLPANKPPPISHFQSLKSPISQSARSVSPSNQTADDTNIKFRPPMLTNKSQSEANVLVSTSNACMNFCQFMVRGCP